MYIHFDKSVRGVYLFPTKQGLAAFTKEDAFSESFLRRFIRLPKALYQFTTAYFNRYRTFTKESALYNFSRAKSLVGGEFLVVELPSEPTDSCVALVGHCTSSRTKYQIGQNYTTFDVSLAPGSRSISQT